MVADNGRLVSNVIHLLHASAQYFDILVEAVFMESFAVINILILSGYC